MSNKSVGGGWGRGKEEDPKKDMRSQFGGLGALGLRERWIRIGVRIIQVSETGV